MYERLIPLFHESGIKKLASSSVLVFGCGGVGSFAIEALARSGIGTLIIVDGDRVALSNLNRQLPALHSTIGHYKTDVLEARINDINPSCRVIALPVFYNEDTKEAIWQYQPNMVFDAIDTMTYKLDIIRTCKAKDLLFITSCGMGNRMDPTKVTVTELSKTFNDPLARTMRVALKKERLLAHTPCVFSDELPLKTPGRRIPASNAFVPSTAGLTAAAYIVRRLLEE